MLTQEERNLLLKISDNSDLLELGRLAIEKQLIEWRDERLSSLMRNNGLVIKERDGTDSTVIRFGPELALSIGLKAIARDA